MTGVVAASDIAHMFEAVKNWGRWGPEDESGALNLITAERRLAGVRSVRHGEAVSCSREIPVEPSVENPRPALHMMQRAGDDCVIDSGVEVTLDFLGLGFHGMATSHIDALCHVFVDGEMYNGYPSAEVKSTGARRNSIMAARDGIVSRGVLLDVPRLWGVEWLELGTAVPVTDLQAAAREQHVDVEPGDIVLVSTGRDARRVALGPWSPGIDGLAGLHPDCVPWFHELDVAVVGSDGVSDPLPSLCDDGWAMPIHQCALVAMGVHLLDNLALDSLARRCADLEQWDFLFTVAPLLIPGGTGSPINAIAML